MATWAYRQWVARGRPYALAQPIADLARALRAHGYTVGTIGDDSHLQANPPEDHAPFSATGWPIASPQPYVHALDIMPARGLPSLARLGAQIIADRNAGLPGAGWIKYINWTDGAGDCWHESWQPDHTRRGSSDIGHIHISARSDATHSAAAAGYDPVARLGSQPVPSPADVPPWPGRYLRLARPYLTGADVAGWQARMHARGWRLAVDSVYGPESERVCRQFQQEKGLQADGIVGPATWAACWAMPVT